MEKLKSILRECGAADAGIIKYSDCEIINPRLADSIGFVPKSVCVGTIPYYTRFCDEPRTVSAYALAYDYHSLIKLIGEKAVIEAKASFPDANFKYFGDHSPINEKNAAAKAGLGIIGANSLLITPKYSSFVFLFELFTDLECDTEPAEIKSCEMCGKCIRICPGMLSGKGECLSSVTQKKGKLSSDEDLMIKNSGTVWGCDFCQTVCPHTKNAIKSGEIYTHLQWFSDNVLSDPNEVSVNNDADFKMRAYSWRGKSTILRNIDILKNKRGNNG